MAILEHWFPISVALGILIMFLHFWSMIKGEKYLQSVQENEEKKTAGIGKYYIKLSKNRVSEFFFFVLMLNSVFILMSIFGFVFNISEATDLLFTIWFAPFGMLVFALLMTTSKIPINTENAESQEIEKLQN